MARLTDPEVIEHLEGNYYIRRDSFSKDKGIGWYFDGRSIHFVCPPFDNITAFTFEDIKAIDWVLCPKE